jgi:hypothetical protein
MASREENKRKERKENGRTGTVLNNTNNKLARADDDHLAGVDGGFGEYTTREKTPFSKRCISVWSWSMDTTG